MKKKWDGYSTRGLLFGFLALCGLIYEVFFSEPETLTVVLYSVVLLLGISLLFLLKSPKN